MKKDKIVGLTDNALSSKIKLNKKLYPKTGLLTTSDWFKRRRVDVDNGIYIRLDSLSSGLYNIGDTEKTIANDVSYASLKDDYWICPLSKLLQRPKWNDIKFFNKNNGCGILSSVHFFWSSEKHINKKTPDNTQPGKTPKFWATIEGKQCLCRKTINKKYNDCLLLLNKLRAEAGLPLVEILNYKPISIDSEQYIYSECFTSEDVSFVELPFLLNKNSALKIKDIIHEFSKVNGAKEYFEMLVLSAYLTNSKLDPYDMGFLLDSKNNIISPAPIINAHSNKKFSHIFEDSNEEIENFIENIDWFSIDKYKSHL